MPSRMARPMRPSGQSSQQVFNAMYTNQVSVNFGKGMADPFVPAFARFLGATTAELGWLQAFVNLFPTVMQVPWGKLSDFLGKRVPFLVVGGVLSFSLYFFMIGVVSAWQLTIVVAAQMFIGSMMIPTWSALVGDVTTVRNRGTVMGRFFAASSLASLLATLVAGTMMPNPEVGRAAATAFVIPLAIAGVCGIAGSLALYNVREGKRKMYASPKRMFAFSMRSFIFMSDLTENLHFRNLVILQTTFNFIMSLIWPLIYFTYIDVVEASLFEIAIMTVISTGAALFFQTKVGKLLDVIGPMPQILVSRFAFVFVPVVYALATAPWHIYLLHAALGFANAMANVAFFAFILDVAPEGKKGEYFAVYNTVLGVATFFGSIIGGYLALFFLSYYGGDLVLALGAVYVISAVGRAACAVWFLKLKDPVQYPKTLRSLIKEAIAGWRARVRSAI